MMLFHFSVKSVIKGIFLDIELASITPGAMSHLCEIRFIFSLLKSHLPVFETFLLAI